MSSAASRSSIRTRLRKWLSGPEDGDADPHQLVEVALLEAFQGPLMQQILLRSGIRCISVEVYDGVTGLEKASLRVSRADFDAANRVLMEHRRS